MREGYDAWNRGDRPWILTHMAPDFDWISPADDPDPGIHRGYDAVEHFWDGWREAVGQLHFEIDRIEEEGNQVIVFARRSGRGHESGCWSRTRSCRSSRSMTAGRRCAAASSTTRRRH